MKRFLALILALTMALALAACGGGNDEPSGGETPAGGAETPARRRDPFRGDPRRRDPCRRGDRQHRAEHLHVAAVHLRPGGLRF